VVFASPDLLTSLTAADFGSFTYLSSSKFEKTASTYISFVGTGDFNGDLNYDLILTQQAGTGVSQTSDIILVSNSEFELYDATDEYLGSPPILSSPGSARVLVEDYNGDSHSDILHIGFGLDEPPFPGDENNLFLSGEEGLKLTSVSSDITERTRQHHDGAVGDVDGDGDGDVVITSLGLYSPTYLYQNEFGSFTDISNALPSLGDASYTTPGLIDVNLDGYADLLLGRWDGSSSSDSSKVYLNSEGSFTQSAAKRLPESGVEYEILLDFKPIDLNGDELPDLAISVTSGRDGDDYYDTPYIQLLVNLGEGVFSDETAFRLPQNLGRSSGWYQDLQVVDVNRDGESDILAQGVGTSSVLYLNDGYGSFDMIWSSSTDERTVALDLDLDGMLDLATVAINQGSSSGTVKLSKSTLENQHHYISNWGGEKLVGSPGTDVFGTRTGTSVLNGGEGIDVIIYSGRIDQYSIVASENGEWQINGALTKDLINAIERLQFADTSVALDFAKGQSGYNSATLIGTAFGADYIDVYFAIGLSIFDTGSTVSDVAQLIAQNNLIENLFDIDSNEDWVAHVYENVIGSAPDDASLALFTGYLNNGDFAKAELLAIAQGVESIEEQVGIVGLQSSGLEYSPVG